MNRTFLLLILFLLIFVLCSAQDSRIIDNVNAQLKAVPSIKTQMACLDNTGFAFKNGSGSPISSIRIDLELNISYKNSGKYPVILDKGSGTVSSYKLYPKDFNSNPNSLSLKAYFDYMETGKSAKEGDSPSERFVILAQDKTFNNSTQIRLLFDYPTQYPNYSDREHLLKLFLSTISGNFSDSNDSNALRKKWLQIGYFWFEGVTAEPLLIHFPDSKKMKMCKE